MHSPFNFSVNLLLDKLLGVTQFPNNNIVTMANILIFQTASDE